MNKSHTMRAMFPAAAPWIFVLLWSSGFVAVKASVQYAPPFKLLFLRGAFSCLAFLILALIAKVRFPSWQGIRQYLLVGMLMQSLFLGGCFYAMSHGLPAAITALITGLQPVLTAIYVSVVGSARLGRWQWAGILIGFVGVYLVLSPGSHHVSLDGWALTGATVGLLGVTAGTLYQKSIPQDGHVFATTLFQYVSVTLTMGIISLLTESQPVHMTMPFMLGLGWMVIGVSVTAVLLLIYMLRNGEATKVATYFYLVPVATAILAWLLFSEQITLSVIAGMGVVVLGMLMVLKK